MGMVELLTLTVRSVFSKSGLTEFSLFFTVLILAVCADYVARRSGVFLQAVDGGLVCAASGAYFFAQYATAHLGEAGFVSMLAGVLGGLLGGRRAVRPEHSGHPGRTACRRRSQSVPGTDRPLWL